MKALNEHTAKRLHKKVQVKQEKSAALVQMILLMRQHHHQQKELHRKRMAEKLKISLQLKNKLEARKRENKLSQEDDVDRKDMNHLGIVY